VEGGARLVPLMLAATGLDTWLDPARLTPELGTLRLLIYPIILLGGICSWRVLRRTQRQEEPDSLGLFGHRLLILLTTALFIRIL
jgi:hypothetical protein